MSPTFLEHRIAGGVGADDGFWAALEEGSFRISRCAGCTEWLWPAHFRCARCGCWDLEWIERELRGTVFAWTRTWYPFEMVAERADDLPYTVALVEIPDTAGARVLGILEGDTENVRIGRAVHGIIDPPTAKTKHYPSIRWILDPEVQ